MNYAVFPFPLMNQIAAPAMKKARTANPNSLTLGIENTLFHVKFDSDCDLSVCIKWRSCHQVEDASPLAESILKPIDQSIALTRRRRAGLYTPPIGLPEREHLLKNYPPAEIPEDPLEKGGFDHASNMCHRIYGKEH